MKLVVVVSFYLHFSGYSVYFKSKRKANAFENSMYSSGLGSSYLLH